mgnify:CR=1 FL=1
MDDVTAFIIQFIRSLDYRLKGLKCPNCRREIRVEAVRLGCCKKHISLEG